MNNILGDDVGTIVTRYPFHVKIYHKLDNNLRTYTICKESDNVILASITLKNIKNSLYSYVGNLNDKFFSSYEEILHHCIIENIYFNEDFEKVGMLTDFFRLMMNYTSTLLIFNKSDIKNSYIEMLLKSYVRDHSCKLYENIEKFRDIKCLILKQYDELDNNIDYLLDSRMFGRSLPPIFTYRHIQNYTLSKIGDL